MDICSVDLNLLVVLEGMLRHRSVSRTAEAMGLSQPATSAALARLREMLADPLFVRTGQGMEPTPRAQELAPAVRRVIDTIGHEILHRAAFDPARAERRFTVLTPDIGEVTFLPGVLARLRQEAPGVQLFATTKPRSAAAQALESGEADLAVGYFPDLQKAGFYQQMLFKTSYACITCARNANVGKALTLKQFLAQPHVVVRPDGREHQFDRHLEDKGYHRKVMLEISHFMSLLSLLPGSDLIATVPQDIAAAVARLVPVREIRLPFKPPQIQVQQYWHRRQHEDPAHRWLRQLFYVVNRRDGPRQRAA